jgi:hypothetical protein
MQVTVDQLSRMSPIEVDKVFSEGEIGQIPDGTAEGVAIFSPGGRAEPLLQRLVRRFAWQGKVVNARSRRLRNRILPLGLQAIVADVYWDSSWFDGKECIVLDYSKRSLLARFVRDEIRRVAPGLYLGLVFWRRTRLMYFTLQFPAA